MSVYNHRPMIPTAQNRISELLDTIKVEFDSLNQEASVFKMQRDDLEHKSKFFVSIFILVFIYSFRERCCLQKKSASLPGLWI